VLGKSVAAAQERPGLPTSSSLQQELSDALAAGKPLVVMVSLDGCVFCRALRQSYLVPMHRDEGLAVVQVDMQIVQRTRTLTGAETTHGQLVRSWGVTIAPTVLFFGRGGMEVAERLVGTYNADFYGAYLDERLATAGKSIRG